MGGHFDCLVLYVYIPCLLVHGSAGATCNGSRTQCHEFGRTVTNPLDIRVGLRCWTAFPRAPIRDQWPRHCIATGKSVLPRFQHWLWVCSNQRPTHRIPISGWIGWQRSPGARRRRTERHLARRGTWQIYQYLQLGSSIGTCRGTNCWRIHR